MAKKFSAIGYDVGRMLSEELDIPVGIISCNIGASRVDAWTAPEVVEAKDYQQMLGNKHWDWHFYKFNGTTKWNEQLPTSESKQELRKYMLNAYRVLLTRARSGMVICVPKGNPNKTLSGFLEDGTRLPEYYDGTYEYLKGLGIEEI